MNEEGQIFKNALSTVLAEIFDGPPKTSAYLLNSSDPGLLSQLDLIDAAAASARPMPGQTTIAAHADHIHYYISLLNRWVAGEENPWAGADWKESWRHGVVTPQQWQLLRDQLRHASQQWQASFIARSNWDEIAATGAMASAAHTAYHLGAIRQIVAALNL